MKRRLFPGKTRYIFRNYLNSGLDRNLLSSLSILWVELIIFIGVGIFYVYTLQPSLTWGDGARIQIEAISGESFAFSGFPDDMFEHDPYPFAKLGIAAWDHPLYVYIGYSLVHLFPGVDALWLVNLISAVFGAATIAVFFRILHDATGSTPASLLASFALTVSHTFWFHASTPEVYTLLSFLILISIYIFNGYQRTGNLSALGMAGFFYGLAAANHLLANFLVIAYIIYVHSPLSKNDHEKVNTSNILIFAAGFILGFLPFLIQFVRMIRIFPLTDIWKPVTGAIFLENSISLEPLFLVKGIIAYVIYLIIQFNPILLMLGFVGLISGRKKYRSFWGKLILLYFIYSLFGMVYQVTDQFAFLMMSHIFFAMAIGLGVAIVFENYSSIKRNLLISLAGVLILITPSFYAEFPIWLENLGITDETLDIPKVGVDGARSGLEYYLNPNKRGDLSAYQFGENTFLNLPQDSMIISQWYTDLDEYLVFSYFSSIKGERADIEILSWLTEDTFLFDSQIVVQIIESQISNRPVYLASLSEEFYNASFLIKKYCIYPDLNLYRIVSKDSGDIPRNTSCITRP